MKKLSREKFVKKYSIDRRDIDEKVSDEMETAALQINETLREKGYTEAMTNIVISKAKEEIGED